MGEVIVECGEGLFIWVLDFYCDLMWLDELGG